MNYKLEFLSKYPHAAFIMANIKCQQRQQSAGVMQSPHTIFTVHLQTLKNQFGKKQWKKKRYNFLILHLAMFYFIFVIVNHVFTKLASSLMHFTTN